MQALINKLFYSSHTKIWCNFILQCSQRVLGVQFTQTNVLYTIYSHNWSEHDPLKTVVTHHSCLQHIRVSIYSNERFKTRQTVPKAVAPLQKAPTNFCCHIFTTKGLLSLRLNLYWYIKLNNRWKRRRYWRSCLDPWKWQHTCILHIKNRRVVVIMAMSAVDPHMGHHAPLMALACWGVPYKNQGDD